MTHNLKALGLALVAVLALGAMAASAAQANKQGILTTENGGSVTLDGVEDAANYFLDTESNQKWECPGSTFVGHRAEVTPHELIPNKSTQATITPNYVNCSSATHKTTVTMNECDLVFKIGQTTTETTHSPYALTENVVCPVGKFIDTEVYFAETNENLLICTYKIGPQEVKGFDIANEVEGSTTLDTLTATGEGKIISERSGACGAKTIQLDQIMNLTFKGTSSVGAKNGVTVTD
jgi:hypothetical protein